MRTATKPVKLGALIKEADKWVSLYVRLRAADQNGTVKCISCNEKMWYLDADCAHFEDRDNMGTRYYLPNLAPACQNCNRFDHYEHLKAWRDKLTQQQENDLNQRAKSMLKFTRPELQELIDHYKGEVAKLKREKHL